MDEKLKKSLTDLIDETLMELEELKKSRFDASEIELKGPGEGIHGKPSNGELDAKKAEDDEDEDEKKKKHMKKDEAKKDEDMGKDEAKKDEDMGKDEEAHKDEDAHKAEDEDAHKAEDDEDEDDEDEDDMDKGENRKADPNGGHHKPVAGEGMKHGQGPSRSPKDHKHHGGGKNNEADPDGGAHRAPYEPSAKSEDKMKKDEGKMGYPKGTIAMKSEEEVGSLMKSMIDDRVKPLEDKLSSILDLVSKIADQPVAPKGITSKAIPLAKSAGEFEPLSKSEVTGKLLDLKKSGTRVDSLDVTKADLGQDLGEIVKKYNLSR